MAHSFISYGDNHARVSDFDLIVLIHLLRSTASRSKEGSKLDDMFSAWDESVRYGGAGNIDLDLDVFLNDKEVYSALLSVLKFVEDEIGGLPDVIEPKYLEKLISLPGIEFGRYQKYFLTNILLILRNLISKV